MTAYTYVAPGSRPAAKPRAHAIRPTLPAGHALAYVSPTGLIRVGVLLPPGTFPLASGPREPLRRALLVLVPGRRLPAWEPGLGADDFAASIRTLKRLIEEWVAQRERQAVEKALAPYAGFSVRGEHNADPS